MALTELYTFGQTHCYLLMLFCDLKSSILRILKGRPHRKYFVAAREQWKSMRFDDGWNNSWHRVGNVPGLIFSTSMQATKAHTREQRIPLIHIWQHGNFISGIFRYPESGLSASDWPSVTKQCGMSIYLNTSLKTGSALLHVCISSTQAFSLVVVQRL